MTSSTPPSEFKPNHYCDKLKELISVSGSGTCPHCGCKLVFQ